MKILLLDRGTRPQDVQHRIVETVLTFDQYINNDVLSIQSPESRVTLVNEERLNERTHLINVSRKSEHRLLEGEFINEISTYYIALDDKIISLDPPIEPTQPTKPTQLSNQTESTLPKEVSDLLNYSLPKKLEVLLSYANEDKELKNLNERELDTLKKAYEIIKALHQ